MYVYYYCYSSLKRARRCADNVQPDFRMKNETNRGRFFPSSSQFIAGSFIFSRHFVLNNLPLGVYSDEKVVVTTSFDIKETLTLFEMPYNKRVPQMRLDRRPKQLVWRRWKIYEPTQGLCVCTTQLITVAAPSKA
jgi:hypothetical protein